jgi:hypothetical protein
MTSEDSHSINIQAMNVGIIDAARQSVMALFVSNILPFFSILLMGPSRSLFEMWHYPFAVP